MKNIASALVKAQKAFGPAPKTSTNPHFRSKYADLSACVEAVIDALNDNGIALVQKCYESERGVTVETVFVHESGETLEAGRLTVPATKQDAQGFGSSLTYGRRYSLMAACGIAPEDDDGEAASRLATKLAQQPAAAFDVGRACSAIAKAESRAQAEHYADVAFERANTNEEKARIANALKNYEAAA